jgi:hypothetical protein
LGVLGTGLLITNLPFSDEGFYGVPAYFLATTGTLKNPILESAGIPSLTGIHSNCYWMVPGAMVLQAAAFKLCGFSLYVQRALSLAAGLGVLLLWWQVTRRLLDRQVAGLACLLLAMDYLFTSLATRGRADMLSLFFAVAALAAYLHRRERSLWQAVLAANACCAVSGLIHPNGGIQGLVALAVAATYLDRDRLRLWLAAVAAVPYIVFGTMWAWWIAQAPSYFIAQFLGNAANRVPHGFGAAVAGEAGRYLRAFGALGGGTVAHAHLVIPIAYLLGVAGCLLIGPKIRNLNLFLILAGLQAVVLLFTEGSKQGWYLVYSMPVLDTLLAVWMLYLWNRQTRWSLCLLGVHALVVLAVLGGLVGLVAKRNYQRKYIPAVAFLNSRVSAPQIVFGRAELFFGMHCRTCLIDDERLGENSARSANWIVIDPDYADNIERDRLSDPATFAFIKKRLKSEYSTKFDDGAFDIRQRDAAYESR